MPIFLPCSMPRVCRQSWAGERGVFHCRRPPRQSSHGRSTGRAAAAPAASFRTYRDFNVSFNFVASLVLRSLSEPSARNNRCSNRSIEATCARSRALTLRSAASSTRWRASARSSRQRKMSIANKSPLPMCLQSCLRRNPLESVIQSDGRVAVIRVQISLWARQDQSAPVGAMRRAKAGNLDPRRIFGRFWPWRLSRSRLSVHLR